MNLFDAEFRRNRPFLTSLLIALIGCITFVGFMLITLPETMDMDGFIHFLATIFILPILFILAFFISYPYFKIRSSLYIAKRDNKPLVNARIQLTLTLLIILATFVSIGFVGYYFLNSSSTSQDYAIEKKAK